MPYIRCFHSRYPLIFGLFFALLLSVHSPVSYAIDYNTPTNEIISQMIQDVILSIKKGKKATAEIYRLSNNELIWLNNKQIDITLTLLRNSGKEGLHPEDYHSKWLEVQWQELENSIKPTFNQLVLFDTTLSTALLRYYSDLRHGRITPRQARFSFKNKKDPILLAEQTLNAIQFGTVKQLGESFVPKIMFYSNLKKALENYKKAAKNYPSLKFTKTLSQGQSGSQVLALRKLLTRLGDFVAFNEIDLSLATSSFYDRSMTAAVKNFQKRHGLARTGKVGKSTLNALNKPLSKRITQIELGLERLRWIPEYEEDKMVFVNVPSFRLWAYDSLKDKNNKPLTMRVVVGKTSKHKTPIFSAKMKFLSFRPYWNIPRSIIRNEINPRLKRNPNYLASRNMERFGRGGIRQKPGSRNALGLVKFMFPNDHAVYLHDTLSKNLFSRSKRDFSHGCIRLSEPANLAKYILKWSSARVKKAMYTGGNKYVGLKKAIKTEIPVIIFYSTAIAMKDDNVTFYNDVYGYDASLRAKLNKK